MTMKNTADILQRLRELENDSNPIHFQDAIAEFLRTTNRTPDQNLELLRTLLTEIKNHEYEEKDRAVAIIQRFVEIEACAEPYYEIRYK